MVGKVVSLEVDGIKIAGQLYLPGTGEPTPYPAVVICHGIPARVQDPADSGYPLLAERIYREGFAVLLFNFRGAGASGGNFDILGWTRDLSAAIDYLWTLPQIDKTRLALVGFSGGAAVSVYIAAQDKRVSAVAACACPAEFSFTQTGQEQVLLEHFRSVGIIKDASFPPDVRRWLDGFRRVSPLNYVAGIAPRPLLLVHGSDDDVVAVSHAHRLYARAGDPKQLVIVDRAGHRLRLDERAMDTVIEWLKASNK